MTSICVNDIIDIIDEIKEEYYFAPGIQWDEFEYQVRLIQRAIIELIKTEIKEKYPKTSLYDILDELYSQAELLLWNDSFLADLSEDNNLILTIQMEVVEDIACEFV